MADLITPTSQLEAVNSMLGAIGEAPISTLTNPGLGDAAVAIQTLLNVSRRIQTIGWSWNTDKNWGFPPDTNGFVFVPANTLRADTTGDSATIDAVLRGAQLYDRGNHTFVFSLSTIYLDIIQALPFEQLPEPARQYIYMAATREFSEGLVGSETLSTFARKNEAVAWSMLLNAEGEDADYNILSGNYSVTRVLDR